MENDGGELLFSMPEGWGRTLSEISEFTGISRIKSSSIEILLPVDKMMTLLAVIDLTRKIALSSYIGNDSENRPIAYADIVRHMGNPGANSFVHMLKKNYNYPVPEAGKVGSILRELRKKDA